MDIRILSAETHDIKQAIDLYQEYCQYDIMEEFAASEQEIPRGERFYDPVYEEVWR